VAPVNQLPLSMAEGTAETNEQLTTFNTALAMTWVSNMHLDFI
jgi:hypothetical protein